MGVSKGLNRLAILGLLACGGAWAQETVTVQVGLSIPGPIFLIDGQSFTTPQVVQWTVGSTHQVYFLQSEETNGTLGNHQYPQDVPGARYTFGGWSLVGQTAVGNSGSLLIVTVGPTLNQVIGAATFEVQLSVYFSGFTDPLLPCSATAVPNDPREGVIVIGSACFSYASTMWITPGPIALTAAALPGYIFSHWLINGNVVNGSQVPAYEVVLPSSVTAVFVKAKRVRFRSNPLGLTLTVDHQLSKPGPTSPDGSTNPYCAINYALLPIGFPVGYVPLCVGDYDFLPGSTHVIGAPEPQSDGLGQTWVFTGFSNGLGQNGVYLADENTSVMDTVLGNFVTAVPTRVLSSPAGLSLNIDGKDDTKGDVVIWAAGQTHHLIAPLTQTDSTGHPWKFVSWSNGGAADQTYTVGAGLPGLTLTATYEPLGKLQVDSVPSGLSFNVDGAVCTTPCILLEKPTGAKVQVVAPASASPDANRRYSFLSWNGGGTSNTLEVTIGDHAQVLVATYQGFYKLTATSQPANHASFGFNPSSADGFYKSGTQVAVTVAPNGGYTFTGWAGDLLGTSLTSSLVMNAPHVVVAVLNGFPYISENGIKNAAGDTPSGAVAPGSDIAIYGDNLASALKTAPAGELSQALDDVWVTLNDRLLPLMFISPNQINAQLFSDLPDGDYVLTVHHTTQQDASRGFKVRRNSPGVFQWYPAQGTPTVAAFREDGSMLTADNRAAINETITVFGTGFGPYDRPLVDGFPTPDTGNWNVADTVKVTVDGQTYTPVSTRAANGFVGMVVMKVKLTGTLPSGLVNFKVTVNNVDSNSSQLPIK